VLLRDHPLMNYRGLPNWPPRWLPRKDFGGEQLWGEVGVLREVVVSCGNLYNRQLSQLFLFIEHNQKSYVSAVLFNDAMFCREVGELMKRNYGRPLEEIGSLDVTGLL
jgi:hypothetical protein